jgi:hypothetical protein
LIPTSFGGGFPLATVEKMAKLAAKIPDTAVANTRRRNVDVRPGSASSWRSDESIWANFMRFSSLKQLVFLDDKMTRQPCMHRTLWLAGEIAALEALKAHSNCDRLLVSFMCYSILVE